MVQLPESLLKSLAAVEGFEEKSFIEAHQLIPPTSIRLNPAKPTDLDLRSTGGVPWCEHGIYLSERPVFTLDPLFHAGAYYVQEASSMFVSEAFNQLFPEKNNLRVLDLCAAPGGKSTLLASLLGSESLLISNEVIRNRATILDENIVRWGYTNNWVTCNDPKDFASLKNYFDMVIIDAPCSGSGLFRKDSYALTSWSEANVELCSARQKRIIADIWDSLKQNGVLLYATCSYSTQEDEAILDWVGDQFPATTRKITVRDGWNIVETTSLKHHFYGYRFFPDKVDGEGFFLAAMMKTEELAKGKPIKSKSQSNEKIALKALSILEGDHWAFIEEHDGVTAIHKTHEPDLLMMRPSLYFRKKGLNIGNFTTKEWIPHHDVALSIQKSTQLPHVGVDKEIALRFLKKEDMGQLQLDKGWYLVTHRNLSLGWIKSLGNRVNNYLPKHWRIRMELPKEDQA